MFVINFERQNRPEHRNHAQRNFSFYAKRVFVPKNLRNTNNKVKKNFEKHKKHENLL